MKNAFPLVLLAGLLGCGSREPAAGPAPKEQPQALITQFYAAAPALSRVESTNLCYGMGGAGGVQIPPTFYQIRPTHCRFFSVRPHGTTTFSPIRANDHG